MSSTHANADQGKDHDEGQLAANSESQENVEDNIAELDTRSFLSLSSRSQTRVTTGRLSDASGRSERVFQFKE